VLRLRSFTPLDFFKFTLHDAETSLGSVVKYEFMNSATDIATAPGPTQKYTTYRDSEKRCTAVKTTELGDPRKARRQRKYMKSMKLRAERRSDS
jgi:hypothetical protein